MGDTTYSISAILKLIDGFTAPAENMRKGALAFAKALEAIINVSKQASEATKDLNTSMSEYNPHLDEYSKESFDEQLRISKALTDIKITDKKREADEINRINEELSKTDKQRAKNIEDVAKREEKAHQEAAKAAVEAAKQAQEAAQTAKESIMRLGESIMEFGQKMHRVGRWLEMKVTLPLVAAGTAATKFAKDYTTSLASIQMLMPKTIGNIGKEIDNIDKFILNLAPNVAKSPKELAEGLESITRILGYNTNNLQLLPNIAKAAFATQTDVKGVTESVISMGYALDDTSINSINRLVDLSMVFRNLTNVEIPALAGGFSKFTNTAKEFNIPFEKTLPLITALTNAMGGSLSRASTAYGYLLMRISRYPSALEILNTKGIAAVFEKIDIKKILESNDPKLLTQVFGGSRTIESVAAIAGHMKKIKEYQEAFKNGFGAAEVAFQAFTSGIGGFNFQWESFKVSLQVTAIEIGKALLPALRSIFKAMQPIFNIIKNMNPETLKMIVSFLILVAAIGPLISFFANLTVVIAGLIHAWGWLVSGTAPLIAIIAGVAIVIGIVITATMKFYNVWDRIFKWFKKMWNGFKDTIYDGVIKPIMNVYYAVSNLLDRLSGKNKKIFGHDRDENEPKYSAVNYGIGDKWFPEINPISGLSLQKWNSNLSPISQKSQSEVTINVKPSSGWDVIVEDVNHSKNTKLIMNAMSYLGVTR